MTIEIPAREQIGAPLDLERGLQQALNGLGQTATTEALSRYDTEGEPIRFGSYVMTSKGRSPEGCKTLFGEVALERHTYPDLADSRAVENTLRRKSLIFRAGILGKLPKVAVVQTYPIHRPQKIAMIASRYGHL